MKKTITYLIKLKDSDLYVTNRPVNETIKYSTDIKDAREFSGLEDASIDMSNHKAIKKTLIETIEYEEVDDEFSN